MTLRRPRAETIAASIVGIALLALLLVIADGRLARGIELGGLLFANLVVFPDMIDSMVRVWFRRRNTKGSPVFPCPTSIPLEVGRFTRWQARLHVRPWAIVVSVYNAEEEIDDFLESLETVRQRVWVIDDGSSDRTILRLRQAGLHVIAGEMNRRKPGAIREILKHLPEEIETVLVLDPDASFVGLGPDPVGEIEHVLFEFQRSGAAAMCPHIRVREDGWLARLQELEYSVSLSLGRKSLGDHTVTSGVAIYRRDALESALARHGLSVYAEDLRNAILLLSAGEKIYYDGRLVVQTEGKRSVRPWFSQRVGWFYGLLKVYTEEFKSVWRFASKSWTQRYQFILFLGVFTILLHPVKVAALIFLVMSALSGIAMLVGLVLPSWLYVDPVYLLLSWMKYTLFALLLLFLSVRRERRGGLLLSIPLYYFYALFHLVPATVGFANWIGLKVVGRRLWADHYQGESSIREEEDELR